MRAIPVLVQVGEWTVYDVRGARAVTIAAVAAIAVLWPILFVVPGWVVVRRVAPDLPPPARSAWRSSPASIVSAHLVDVVARVTGFGLAGDRRLGRPPRDRDDRLRPGPASLAGPVHPADARRRRARRLRDDAPAWLIAAAVGGLVAVVLFGNGWRETADGWVSGGWNWSDLLVHVAIGSSIVARQLPAARSPTSPASR